MVAPLSEVPQEGSSVFSLFSLIKLHLASHPLARSYSHVAVSSAFCAQYIHISAQTRVAPLNTPMAWFAGVSIHHIHTRCCIVFRKSEIGLKIPTLIGLEIQNSEFWKTDGFRISGERLHSKQKPILRDSAKLKMVYATLRWQVVMPRTRYSD